MKFPELELIVITTKAESTRVANLRLQVSLRQSVPVKIVGRNYSSQKKIKDIEFIKSILDYLKQNSRLSEKKFRSYVEHTFKKIYKIKCKQLCYYP